MGNVGAAKLLIEHGAFINDDDKFGMTALHIAALRGHVDLVKLLIEKGANKNDPDHHGRTPFFFACQGGNTETARYLLDTIWKLEGAEINRAAKDGTTPLRKVCVRGNLEIGGMLLQRLERDSAIDSKDSKLSQTVLHSAAYNCRKHIVDLLLDSGAATRVADKNCRTPVDMCMQGWIKSDSEDGEGTLLALLDADFSALSQPQDLLCIAVVKGSTKIVEKLVDSGVDPNAKDEHGWTPSQLAKHYKQGECFKLLSEKGAMIRTRPTRMVSSMESISISEDGLDVKQLPGHPRIT